MADTHCQALFLTGCLTEAFFNLVLSPDALEKMIQESNGPGTEGPAIVRGIKNRKASLILVFFSQAASNQAKVFSSEKIIIPVPLDLKKHLIMNKKLSDSPF